MSLLLICYVRHKAFQGFEHAHHFRSEVGIAIGALLAQVNHQPAQIEARLVVRRGWVDDILKFLHRGFVDLRHVIVQERSVPQLIVGLEASSQLEQHHTEAEHVDFRGEETLRQKLWRQVGFRAENSAHSLTLVVHMALARQPKIADFRFAARVEENVGWLDVTVDQRLLSVSMEIL